MRGAAPLRKRRGAVAHSGSRSRSKAVLSLAALGVFLCVVLSSNHFFVFFFPRRSYLPFLSFSSLSLCVSISLIAPFSAGFFKAMSPLACPLPLRAAPVHCSVSAPPRRRTTTGPSSSLAERPFVAAAAAATSSSSSESLPGAPGARTAEAAAERQQLFNEIAPMYDLVRLKRHQIEKRRY